MYFEALKLKHHLELYGKFNVAEIKHLITISQLPFPDNNLKIDVWQNLLCKGDKNYIIDLSRQRKKFINALKAPKEFQTEMENIDYSRLFLKIAPSELGI